MRLLEHVLEQIAKQHAETKQDLRELKKDVEELKNFKWRVIGAATSATLIVQVIWTLTSKYLDIVRD